MLEKRLTVLRAIDKSIGLGDRRCHVLLGTGTKGRKRRLHQGRRTVPTTQLNHGAHLYVCTTRTALGSERTKCSDDHTSGPQSITIKSRLPRRCRTNSQAHRANWFSCCELRPSEQIRIDPSVVRGLEYYTGPVFEVELTFSTDGKDGSPRFGSVGGGGRYDGLVSRFRGEPVPATGFSIGVSRLLAALDYLGKVDLKTERGPVVVTVFDRDRIADYQAMVAKLRNAGIRAELYLGAGKFGPQMKYADRRNAPCVVIQGSDEKAKGEVTIKDLIVGAELAKLEKGREEHLQKQAQAQRAVPEDKLVEAVRDVLARHGL